MITEIANIILLVIVGGGAVVALINVYQQNKKENTKEESNTMYLNDKIIALTDEREELEKALEELTIEGENLAEQLHNLDDILQGQEIKVECPCTQNTFVGVFVPEQDNFVKCDNCHEEINIRLESSVSVMPSSKTPDQIFDEVVKTYNKGGDNE